VKEAGHEVLNPFLNDDDFDAALRTAQAECNQHQPDVVVGSSRGGPVAMNIKSGNTPLVLLCPAWKNWGTVTKLKPNSVILHGRVDDVIPFSGAEELVAQSGLPTETLIEVGNDHRLADPEPLKARLLISVAPAGLEKMFFEVGRSLAAAADTAPPPSQADIKKLLEAAPRYGVEIKVPH
jgi:hypothetical protein